MPDAPRTAARCTPLLQFWYTNYKGERHLYVIDPEPELVYDRYNPGGRHPDADFTWTLSGQIVTRDGDARPELSDHPGGRRRTFLLRGMNSLQLVPRSQ